MHSSAPLVAVGRGGECIRDWSGEGGPVSLLATDRVCSVKLSSCAGVAYLKGPMRGDIDGLLSAACMSDGRRPSGLPSRAGESGQLFHGGGSCCSLTGQAVATY